MYQVIILKGQPVLVTTGNDQAILSFLKKCGVHVYHVRHSDRDWDFPVAIEEEVLFNYWGAIISQDPIDLCCVSRDGRKYAELSHKDIAALLDVRAKEISARNKRLRRQLSLWLKNKDNSKE